MNPFELAMKIIQKPQSIAMGVLGALDPAQAGRQTIARNIGRDDDNFTRWDALTAGFTDNITPADSMDFGGIDSMPTKIYANAMNLLQDPLIPIGAAAKGLAAGSRVGSLMSNAGSIGKLGEGANAADKAAQIARRFVQGGMATGGDYTGGLLYAGGGEVAERLAQSALGRLGTKAAAEVAGDGVERALSRTPVDEELARRAGDFIDMEGRAFNQRNLERLSREAMEADLQRQLDEIVSPPELNYYRPEFRQRLSEEASRYRGGAGPDIDTSRAPSTELVPFDPVVARGSRELQAPDQLIQEYLKYVPNAGPQGMAFDLDLPFTRAQKLLENARSYASLNRTVVPNSDEGLSALQRSMKNGMPAPERGPLALNPAPTPIPLGVEAPSTLANRAALQELLSTLPDQSPAWPVEVFGKKPLALPAGRPPMIPETIQGIDRLPEEIMAPAMPVSMSPKQPLMLDPVQELVKELKRPLVTSSGKKRPSKAESSALLEAVLRAARGE